ncbi:MAG TPA: DedA family protein [Candidatus Competibacteraceae bacterium]|nr:DedA family protein [Candidatus Competibacteraceae bacterium]
MLDFFAKVFGALDYSAIFVLMALESSLFPVPSEAVMIPAGYLVASGELDFLLALLAGTVGSIAGASANYVLGKYVGKAFLLRYGRYLLINERKYHEAEALFLRNANRATFVGRLLPVIRHLISLPAGVFRMNYPVFVLVTGLGAGLWCAILMTVGYHFGEPAMLVITHYTHEVSIAVAVLLVLGGAWFVLRRR